MDTIDVHGLRRVAALQQVADRLARLQKDGFRGELRIVHGYGSQGKGGVLRDAIRAWLSQGPWDFLQGELTVGNPGLTIVKLSPAKPTGSPPRKPRPASRDTIGKHATTWVPTAEETPYVTHAANDIDLSHLPRRILDLCRTPKPLSTILGKLRRFGQPAVRGALDKLVKKQQLTVTVRGKIKFYLTRA